jgi:amidase/aspartyl-tRNA(Asn)/glutamyl-tRNA(Gln) amidotransferase subunit A
MSASELAMRIRRRDVSPVEVVDAAIARIEKRNPSITALVFTAFDEARRDAKKAEQAVMSGEALGPLHGVPSAIKDLFDFKPGWKSTFGGVPAMKDYVVNARCMFSERIENAGAIFIGKTNSPVLGFRGVTDNPLFGPSRNPFNTAKNTGGSSGGSAGAVADGLLPFAEGTDGGGSIRIPSSFSGVFGYKASFGRIPYVARPNAFGATGPFLFEGPITRTVEDAALAMSVLGGYDPRDPYCIDQPIDFMASTRRSIRGWKIAYSPTFDIYPVDRRVRAIVDKAVRAFEEAGAHVEEVKVGIKHSQQELSDLWCRMVTVTSLIGLEGFAKSGGPDLMKDHAGDMPRQVLHWAEVARKMTALEWMRDQGIRTEVYDAVQGVLNNYDLLVTPTLACLPVDNAETKGETVGPTQIEGETVDPLIGWCMTYPINYSGHPAASVPAGLAEGNLPVGMQIIGRRYADTDVLAASAAFERLRPWKDTYKICESRKL